jgi:hypothetical protein
MERPVIDPPIRGEWKVIHSPGDSPHALDFIGLQPGTRFPYPRRSLLTHLFFRIPATTAFGWNRPVYAPFDGEILEARDGYPDTAYLNLLRDFAQTVIFPPELDDDIQQFAGNYAVIEAAAGVAFLAHLQRGSVKVTAGDTVTAGEKIGVIGNAGASLIPHLHFQLLSEWTTNITLIREKDRPFRFRQYERWVDGSWKLVHDRQPEHSERIRIET